MMESINNDIPKYKKKSQRKPPKKSKHKHIYEPCLLEIPLEWYAHPHERSGKTCMKFGSYCPVCGKIGDMDRERWWIKVERDNGVFKYLETVYSKEAERELNPSTRTIPCLKVEDRFAKFVEIGGIG
jgi:hypothetical protein